MFEVWRVDPHVCVYTIYGTVLDIVKARRKNLKVVNCLENVLLSLTVEIYVEPTTLNTISPQIE